MIRLYLYKNVLLIIRRYHGVDFGIKSLTDTACLRSLDELAQRQKTSENYHQNCDYDQADILGVGVFNFGSNHLKLEQLVI